MDTVQYSYMTTRVSDHNSDVTRILKCLSNELKLLNCPHV